MRKESKHNTKGKHQKHKGREKEKKEQRGNTKTVRKQQN